MALSYTDSPSAGDVQVAPRTIAKNVAFRSAAERLLLVTVLLNTAGGIARNESLCKLVCGVPPGGTIVGATPALESTCFSGLSARAADRRMVWTYIWADGVYLSGGGPSKRRRRSCLSLGPGKMGRRNCWRWRRATGGAPRVGPT